MPADTTQTPFDAFVAPARKKPAIWRIILGFIVILAAFILGNEAIIYGIARFFPLTTVDDVFAAREPLTLAFLLATFAPICLGVWCAARWVHGRSLGSVIGPRHIFLRDFATATATFVAVSTVMFVLWSFLHDTTPNLPLGIFLKWLPLMLVLLFLQTGAEELIFRGYLPQQLRARFQSPLIWYLLPAVAFASLHHDPTLYGAKTWIVLAASGLSAILWMDLTIRSGSLGMAWGWHFANNAWVFLILCAPGELDGASLFLTPYTFADMPTHIIFAEIVTMLCIWAILRWVLYTRETAA